MIIALWCLHPTKPAPINVAARAVHVVAPAALLRRDLAAWAPRNRRHSHPAHVGQRAFILASALVPDSIALPAHQLAAFALRLVPAASWFPHDFAAVRFGAPLELLALADPHIVSDDLISLLDLL